MPLALTRADVTSQFDARTFARGEAYASGGAVRSLAVDEAAGTVVARVSGTSMYDVRVYVSRGRGERTIVSGFCTCPIGGGCKHVAATLIVALAEPAAAPAARPRAAATSEPLALWLDRIEATSRTATAPSATEQRVAYVFRDRPSPDGLAFPLELVVERLSASGRWTKMRDVTSGPLAESTAVAVVSEDREIGRLCDAYRRLPDRHALAAELVPRIVATGRARYAGAGDSPLALGPPRRATIAWSMDADGTQRPALRFEEPNALPTLVAGWYYDSERHEIGPIDAGIAVASLAAVLDAPALGPAEAAIARERIARAFPALSLAPIAERTERRETRPAIPRLRLATVTPPDDDGPVRRLFTDRALAFDVAELTMRYGDEIADPHLFVPQIRRVDGAVALTIPRERPAEIAALAKLDALELQWYPELQRTIAAAGPLFGFEEPSRWARFLHELPALREAGWIVEIDASFRRRLIDATRGDEVWRSSVAQRENGWFDVAIGIEHEGGSVDLLAVLAALLKSHAPLVSAKNLATVDETTVFYATLPDGTMLALPASRVRGIVETLVELGDPASRADGAILLPRSRATVVDRLARATGLNVDAPARLRALAERLRSAASAEPTPVPVTFRGTLREYQQHGLDWLQFLASQDLGGILADDMGLGKSVQALAHLLVEKDRGRLARPALLVVPTSLVFNWCDEAARFAPSLRVLALHGPERAASYASIDEHDLVITTYPLLVRDAILREREWRTAIFDEAQMLKNPTSKATVAAMAIRADHRLCLTGTPVENHLGDLWSLLSIAVPDVLGDKKSFNRLFRTPIERHADVDRQKHLAERIVPFVLRRTKDAVAEELPPKTEIVRRVELAGAQRDLYETVRVAMHDRVRAEIAANGLARSQIVILDALLKLRQVCCDPRLLKGALARRAPSVKLDLLLEILPEMIAEGRRVLVFSQFTSMLDLIAPELDDRAIGHVTLTGQTKERAEAVARFQAGAVPIFLISLKAGGTGLNLTAADTVIHYDPWWNPAVERQATDRAHRIGQTKHVFAYKLIGAGTVEEKILSLQERKAALAAAIFSDERRSAAAFDADDIARLFAPIDT